LFAEGALSTSFITTFTKTISTDGDRAAWRLANKVATATVIILGSITILGIISAPWLVHVLAPGFQGDKAELTVTLTRIMYPFILMVSLAALVMGMLNAKDVFGVPAMASSFFNIGSIVCGLVLGYWLDPGFGPKALLGLAIGTLFGGLLQLLVQLPSLRRTGYVFHPDFQWRDKGVKAILRLMGPSVIAASTTQVNVLVNSVFASQLGDGPTFWLSIAFRLMQLPLGIFGVALGTVSLPLLSRMAAVGNMGSFRSELSKGMRLAFLMTIPSTIGLMMLAEPIMSVLYQHNKFRAHEAAEAAGALRFYAIGLSGYAALKVLVNAFYALDRRKTPMLVSFSAVALNLLLNGVFTLQLGWGHRGLALSTSCIATSNFLILYWLMRRQLTTLETGAMLTLLGKLAIAGGALAGVCWLGGHYLLADWATQPFAPKLTYLLGTIAIAGAAFVAVASVLQISELNDITAAVMRRLRRKR
jgi:putative peptidoglycan lipid II flippase